MKLLKDPIEEKYGIDYIPRITNDFKNVIDSAKEKIAKFSNEEISTAIVYFAINGDIDPEYDCCDNENCIEDARNAIIEDNGKDSIIESISYRNDGDNERINQCSVCNKALNENLTWVNTELEHIEEKEPWSLQFIKDEAFLIMCILDATPSMDNDISDYAKNKGGEVLKESLKSRELFFQRVYELAQFISESNI